MAILDPLRKSAIQATDPRARAGEVVRQRRRKAQPLVTVSGGTGSSINIDELLMQQQRQAVLSAMSRGTAQIMGGFSR